VRNQKQRWAHSGLVVLAAMVGGLVMACGGSSSGAKPGGDRAVALAANTQITPWSTDEVSFQVSPPLAGDESMSCQIDQGPEQACAVNASSGRVAYRDLAQGEHVLTVNAGRANSKMAHRVTWRIVTADVLVYGGTPSGIAAALSAARAGRSVVLVEASSRLGGMMTGGLAKSDVGSAEESPLGGITEEFFDRTRRRETELGACSSEHPCPVAYDFEPHVAGEVFAAMLAEQPLISIQRSLPLRVVHKDSSRLTHIVTDRGEMAAGVFIDASYEGDLMVAAGVSHVSGREARRTAGDGAAPGDIEDHAGFAEFRRPQGLNVDPFVIPGDSASGLIPFVEPMPDPVPALGSADDRLMAYNYRICVTDDPGNRVPFDRPADFDPALYEGSARVAVALAFSGKMPLDELYFNPHPTVRSKNRDYFKYDLNGGPAFSTDVSAQGWNQPYPKADATQRAAIAAAYRSYGQGLLYAWRTDPRFGDLNAKLARFGYCADEFADNAHWPHALYVRESRRMAGEYVMNENDVSHNGRRPVPPDSIGMGSYGMDSHFRRLTTVKMNSRDVIVTEGFGVVHPQGDPRYRVPYRSLLPRRQEASNLLNPVTPSSTSMAFRSLRMEPTMMVLGQAAGTAAAMAVESTVGVQDVSVTALQSRLRQAGQILE
jgi:hypothetical protein